MHAKKGSAPFSTVRQTSCPRVYRFYQKVTENNAEYLKSLDRNPNRT